MQVVFCDTYTYLYLYFLYNLYFSNRTALCSFVLILQNMMIAGT